MRRRFSILFLLLLSLTIFSCINERDTLGNWRKGNQYPGMSCWGAVSFRLGDEVYVGLGQNEYGDNLTEFFALNTETNVWSKIEAFPGIARHSAVAFVIGNKAYVGTGAGIVDEKTTYFKDFYSYDGTTWQAEPDFAGDPRYSAVAFTIGETGYVGTGYVGRNQGLQDGVLADFYTFTEADGWTPMTPAFPGTARRGAVAFVYEGKGYVCLGTESEGTQNNNPELVTDFYVYDSAAQSWSALTPIEDAFGRTWDNDYDNIPRYNAAAFVAYDALRGMDFVYVVGGSRTACWSYNPASDRWEQVSYLPSSRQLQRPVAFSNLDGTVGFVSTGSVGTTFAAATQSTWRFFPGAEDRSYDDSDY